MRIDADGRALRLDVMPIDEANRPAIQLSGVIKRFGRATVLDQVDLSVPAGEITVLLGPSGAGKTVTISHIVGLMHPDRGRRQGRGQGPRAGLRGGANRAAPGDGGGDPGHAAVHLRAVLFDSTSTRTSPSPCASAIAGPRPRCTRRRWPTSRWSGCAIALMRCPTSSRPGWRSGSRSRGRWRWRRGS